MKFFENIVDRKNEILSYYLSGKYEKQIMILQDKKEKATTDLQQKEERGIPLRSFNIMKVGKWNKKIANFLKDKYFTTKTVLVNMELLNGSHKTFLVLEKEGAFKFKKKMFLFDAESKYYNIDAKLWTYDFHENFTLPLKREIPIADIKKAVEFSKLTEIEYATNPMTLERFVISKIAEGIMKGQAIDQWIRQIKIILIIVMAASLIHLMLFMFKTGMLQQMKLPFG